MLKEILNVLNVKTIEEAASLIKWGKVYVEKEEGDIILPPDHNKKEEAIAFLKAIVDNDDNRGIIMLKDGTWLDRIMDWDEYEDEDGNEYCDWIGWEWVRCKSVTHNYYGPEFETCITH